MSEDKAVFMEPADFATEGYYGRANHPAENRPVRTIPSFARPSATAGSAWDRKTSDKRVGQHQA